MTESTEKRLQRIAKMTDRVLADKDKEYIEKSSEKLGLTFEPKSRTCGNCYADQAALIYKTLKDKESGKSDAKFVLYAGVDVIFRGYRVNEATITDTLCEVLLGLGFNPRYFKKMPKNGN